MDRILQFIPFLLFARNTEDGNGCKTSPIKLNTQRIIEGVIIAAIAGAVSGYVSVAKLEVKVDGLKSEVKAVEQRMCDENKRQETRIDDTLNRVERLSNILLKEKIR